ncbi:hypothetical protein KIW84_011774 [Lathyrus oleraceus]|uniref:Uncharacterized protein n=1 Tax=Pisum sativum TaxID=3888 RepID=A0A9D5BFS8_PEA|nr:hypothetical protein KIW84_011774 [Pisum sativum]
MPRIVDEGLDSIFIPCMARVDKGFASVSLSHDSSFGSTGSLSQLCKSVVEPRDEESDHVHITALSDPSCAPIRIVYLDHNSCDTGGVSVNHHDPIPSADDLPSSRGSSEKQNPSP